MRGPDKQPGSHLGRGSGYDFLPIPNHLRILAKRLDTRRVYAPSLAVLPNSHAVDRGGGALLATQLPASAHDFRREEAHSKRCAITLSMIPYCFASSAVRK